MDHATHLLKDFELRLTKPRAEILSVFIAEDFALSHADLEKKLKDNIDRVTIYRTLNTFEENGLVHKVLDFDGVTKYALCKKCSKEKGHHHEHIHFKCVRCEQTNCLESISIPEIALPQGFEFIEANFLIQGICEACSNSTELT